MPTNKKESSAEAIILDEFDEKFPNACYELRSFVQRACRVSNRDVFERIERAAEDSIKDYEIKRGRPATAISIPLFKDLLQSLK